MVTLSAARSPGFSFLLGALAALVRPAPWVLPALALLCVVAVGCAKHSPSPLSPRQDEHAGPSLDEDLTPIDPAADPCTDFARFACGPEESRSGSYLAYDLLARRRVALRHFVESVLAANDAQISRPAAVIGEFFRRCTDDASRTAGLAELAARADGIAKIASLEELARTLGELRRDGLNLLVSLRPAADRRDAAHIVLGWIGLAGPILPRPFYASPHHHLQDYRQHWERLGALSGIFKAEEAAVAARIDDLLAKEPEPEISRGREPVRPFDVASLENRRFPWKDYLAGLGVAGSAPLAWRSDRVGEQIDRIMAQPLSDLKSYLRVLLVERWAEYASRAMLEEERQFHRGVLLDRQQKPESIADVCVILAGQDLEDTLASAYLPVLADPAAEAVARNLFDGLRARATRRMRMTPWLDGRTKETAVSQMNATKLVLIGDAPLPELGAPTKPPGSLFDFFLREREGVSGRQLGAIGEPEKEPLPWLSFHRFQYLWRSNTLWVSPEIVRRPYVRSRGFNATTFGALGSVLGAGIGFVLPLARYQAERQGTPWPAESVSAYEQRAACLTNQAEVLGWTRAGDLGRQAATDNMVAELMGVGLALEAMETGGSPGSDQPLDALRREFFLAHAQALCKLEYRPRSEIEEVRSRYAPPRVRVNAVVASLPQFAKAFHCAAGTPMSPPRRCDVW